MQPQQNSNGTPQGSADQSGALVCAQCGSPMPKGMRFCRSCGNRLGEGPAEYTETVRFPNAPTAVGSRPTNAFTPGFGAPMVRPTGGASPYKRRRRLGGMTWVFIVMAFFFAGGGVLSIVKKAGNNISGVIRTTVAERSYFGVNNFESTDGGVTFENVEPPGSPADKAGLVGGDIITSFDGHAVADEDEMFDLLRQTPIGKSVEVIYIRDGETKKTQLTTISQGEFNELQRAFANRPQGVARLGFDSSDARRVAIPGTKIYGVRLDDFNSNGPAALAGMEKGDIITQLDNVPIRTVDEFISRIHRAIPYTTVKLTVMRGTEQIEIPVKLGK